MSTVLGPALKECREAAGLSQAELAERIGIGQGSVSNIETGARTPSVAVTDRWLEACGGTMLVRPARPQDPLAGLTADQRADAEDLLRRWVDAPQEIRTAILMTLRATVPRGPLQ